MGDLYKYIIIIFNWKDWNIINIINRIKNIKKKIW